MSQETDTGSGLNEAPTSSAALRALRLESAAAALLAHGPLSRTELAEITGYSRSSMTATIRELIAGGFVKETGHEESTGGRRRTIVQFDRRAVHLSLVSIEGVHVLVSQIDLVGSVEAQLRRRLNHDDPLSTIIEALRALHAASEHASRCVVVSLPGVMSAEGDVSLAPALGASMTVRLRDALGEAIGLPVLVENDVNLVALGESTAGAARDHSDVVLIYVGDGIGSALLLDGRIHRGATGSAGEVGFLPWDKVMPSASAAVGPLEARWAVGALVTRAAELGIDCTDHTVVAELAASEDPDARALLEGAVEAWAYAAVVTAYIMNPALVVFAGEAVHLPKAARAALAGRVTAAVPAPIKVRFAHLGEGAIAQGAIAHIETRPRLVFALDVPFDQAPDGKGAATEGGTPPGDS
ncbi:ROK family transcriptional regulator [Propioniciclava coleopterorum]|uniref:ROK family transcriptional regulator n=1 Tax=Propioniciclava coleopterorum TaxID=2714937 RepID=A0A6G7Y9K3_9ACTN|nr:ROK family transcriptional regulator [Propioniciclava coleopterorum]QIK73574.1 ROK family transcriptional regulator [Propioniciclava coleopterorum]